ncbi:MAG: glutamate racemase [Cyanobacteria bacterium]|nr:glutamate racemase [Cyanobacteriota bacterium]MEB3268497.1 glutamate racemase [Leptolyngbya sp.]
MTAYDTLADPRLTSAPIGIFDSGVGGLTVLRQLDRQLPQESILYFGDTARLPYGNRTADEILHFVRDIIGWMVDQGAKMVMMACNTSSALALEQVQQEFEVPILGLIWPGARAAAQAGQRIGVIATPATVASDAYRQAILEVNPQAQVWQVGCPAFVPLIEQGRIQHPETRRVAARYLQPLMAQGIDALVYGCTHYPHLEPVFQTLLSSQVQRVDPATHLVAAAVRELTLLNLKHTGPARPTRFYVSGDPQGFADLSVRWLGYRPQVEQVVFSAATVLPGGS